MLGGYEAAHITDSDEVAITHMNELIAQRNFLQE